MRVECAVCGTAFNAQPHRVAVGLGKFCSRRCMGVGRKRKHGESKSRLYRIWNHMKQRCSNRNVPFYHRYGGRGITVCPEWQNSYLAFRGWALANGYEGGLTIDRKENNGNYEPGNCRWVTTRDQNRNRRGKLGAKSSRFKGVSWHKGEKKWRATIGVNGKSTSLGYFRSEEDAAAAYDRGAVEFFGDFALVNIAPV